MVLHSEIVRQDVLGHVRCVMHRFFFFVFKTPEPHDEEFSTGAIDLDQFAARLWGNIYYHPDTRKFSRTAAPGAKRGFEHFIMEPLYKLYSQVLGEDTDQLKKTLGRLGIHFKASVYKMDVRPLLRLVLNHFFGPATGFVDMVSQHIPNPVQGAKNKVSKQTRQFSCFLRED